MLVLSLVVVIAVCFAALSEAAYKVGAGIYDITGPAAEINFMGYAVPGQRGQGIHLRLRARAFAVGDESKTVAFVSVDGGMASDLVKMRVLDELDAELGKGVYTNDNLSISGTHTHSGPAGFLQYVLYQVTSLGYVKETFDAWVHGIAQAVIMAHKNLEDAKIYVNQATLQGANINRSPTSYLLNPQEERDLYPDGDTDKNMLLLKFVSEKTGKPIGVVNWFAVHATSMNNTNTLISGDNKGYAAYAMEKDVNGPNSLPGMGPFVSAFASSNLGDVSPNTMGPKCIDTGLPCDGTHSSCNGKCEMCIASGPGTNGDMVESTQIIGDKQYKHAVNLMETATEEVVGPVDYRHSFVDMSTLNVTLSKGRNVQLCKPSMGYAFAAGTTDGPGMFNFTQGTTTGNIFWDKVRDFLSKPTKEEIACQHPKPILLNTGDIERPYQWDPTIVPLQVFRVGNIFIVSVPGEFTTMSGRRLRATVKSIIEQANILMPGQQVYVTLAGLANTYSSYITTYEEYQAQRYEAASTIFGPNTLAGYQQEYARIVSDLINNRATEPGLPPPDLMDVQMELMPKSKYDRVPRGVSFGDVVKDKDVASEYSPGEIAQVTFHSANPRNNQHIQGSFLSVERQYTSAAGITRWETVATDGDWETKFRWHAGKDDKFGFELIATSVTEISWAIPTTAKAGTYRICHFGDHKMAATSKVVPFSGCSSAFSVSG